MRAERKIDKNARINWKNRCSVAKSNNETVAETNALLCWNTSEQNIKTTENAVLSNWLAMLWQERQSRRERCWQNGVNALCCGIDWLGQPLQ